MRKPHAWPPASRQISRENRRAEEHPRCEGTVEKFVKSVRVKRQKPPRLSESKVAFHPKAKAPWSTMTWRAGRAWGRALRRRRDDVDGQYARPILQQCHQRVAGVAGMSLKPLHDAPSSVIALERDPRKMDSNERHGRKALSDRKTGLSTKRCGLCWGSRSNV